MAVFAVDSSCQIAAVSSWHAHRERTQREIERRLESGDTMLLPAQSLVEAFSVLTRLPARHRLAPVDAWTLLEANFVTGGRVYSLDASAYTALIARLAHAGIQGGRVYDEVIAESAVHGGAMALLTLNPKHFAPPPPGVAIVDPSAAI